MNRQNQMVGSWRPSLGDSMTTYAMLSNRTNLEGCFYFMQLHLIVDVKGRFTLCSQNMWQKKDNIIYIKVKRKRNIAATIIYIPGIPRYLCFKFYHPSPRTVCCFKNFMACNYTKGKQISIHVSDGITQCCWTVIYTKEAES